MLNKRQSKGETVEKRRERSTVMGVSKHRSRKGEESKGGGSTCGQATKGAAREEAGIFYIEKGTGVL